jgi:hypothetical protein
MTVQPRDPELRGHARRFAPRVQAVRLNRVTPRPVDAPLVVVGPVGLLASLAHHSRLTQDPKPYSSRLAASAGGRRSDTIRDREARAQRASMNLGPAPARRPASPSPGKTVTDADLEARRRECAMRAAMAAPIVAAAFETRWAMARGSGAAGCQPGSGPVGRPRQSFRLRPSRAQTVATGRDPAPRSATPPPDRHAILPAPPCQRCPATSSRPRGSTSWVPRWDKNWARRRRSSFAV